MNTRYTGPTLLTYEEWWKWDSQRVRKGKGSSTRKVVPYCCLCHRNIHDSPHQCPSREGRALEDWFTTTCERVMVTTEGRLRYEDGEGPVY